MQVCVCFVGRRFGLAFGTKWNGALYCIRYIRGQFVRTKSFYVFCFITKIKKIKIVVSDWLVNLAVSVYGCQSRGFWFYSRAGLKVFSRFSCKKFLVTTRSMKISYISRPCLREHVKSSVPVVMNIFDIQPSNLVALRVAEIRFPTLRFIFRYNWLNQQQTPKNLE